MPSRAGYVIAGVVALAGLVLGGAGAYLGIRSVSDRVDAFQRADVPGNETVAFTDAGDFTLYYEAPGSVGDEGVTVSLPPLRVTLAPVSGGAAVKLADYGGSFTYSFGGHDGRAIATFHVDEPGTYALSSDADVAPGVAQLAGGEGLARTFAVTGLSGLLIGLAQLAAGLLVLVTWLRRRRTAQRPNTAAGAPVS